MMRRVSGFFYGLFMDAEVLARMDVYVANGRNASVAGYALRIGKRATLVPMPDAVSYGVVYCLTHTDLEKLYGSHGLEAYKPEALAISTFDGEMIPALCYNLPEAPTAQERNTDYARNLRFVLSKLGFPPEYIASVN